MAERPSWATSVAGGQISVEDARVAIGGAFVNGGVNVTDARSGWLPAPNTITPGRVTANSTPNNSVNIAPFMRIQQSIRGKGPYIMCLDTSKAINILSTPADPTNPRNDLIIAQQSDAFYGDANSLMSVKQVVGTPAGSPVDPTVTGSTDYVLLARVRVLANATTIPQTQIDDLRSAQFAVASGAILPVANATERNAITAPPTGFTILRLDRLWHEFYTGSGWQIIEQPIVTNFADLATFITSPYAGQTALVTSVGALYMYYTGAWGIIEFPVTSAGGYARYKATVVQSIPNSTDTPIQFPTAIDVCSQVTPSGTGNSIFTLNLGGIWTIEPSFRYDTSTGAGERHLYVATGTSSSRYTGQSVPTCPIGVRSQLGGSVTKRFAAATAISILAFQTSGTAVNSEVATFTEAVSVSFLWEGP